MVFAKVGRRACRLVARSVAGRILAVAGLVALAAPAGAQYYGDPYGYASPYRYDGAEGGEGYAEPSYDPRPRRPRRESYAPEQGQPYTPEQEDGGGSRWSPYVEPYDGGRAGGTGAESTATTRTLVPDPTRQPPGTIVIDTGSRHLYLTQGHGQALRYGIGVGREGFAWHGVARVERKSEWPSWTPPADMVRRRPDLPLHMEGGLDNPLGARALYLFQGNRDTLFRIHGTNEPDTIGRAVSSGCIRMMNADVIDLYGRVPVGTRVVVL